MTRKQDPGAEGLKIIESLSELAARHAEADHLLSLFWLKYGPYDLPLSPEDKRRMQKYFDFDDSA